MARNRTDFTDKQKAEIFCRDRATCCFSGANLWLLDSPLRDDSETDRADHVKPASKGGKSEAENDVCAAHTFNIKKRNNSSDTSYLFRNGPPTPLYFSVHGVPPKAVTDRLERLARLIPADWYFNRMIVSIRLALHYRCWSGCWDSLPTRDDKYWLKAGFSKLEAFRKASAGFDDIVTRLKMPEVTDAQRTFLSLTDCHSLPVFSKSALELSSEFTRNSKTWDEYFHPEEYEGESKRYDSRRQKTYAKALKHRERLNTDTFDCIQADYFIRFGDS